MAKIGLNYTLSVLQKVSFNSELFTKEVRKAGRYLLPNEWVELYNWLKTYTSDKPELQPALNFFSPNGLFV